MVLRHSQQPSWFRRARRVYCGSARLQYERRQGRPRQGQAMMYVQVTLGAAASTAIKAAMVRGGEAYSCQMHAERASPLHGQKRMVRSSSNEELAACSRCSLVSRLLRNNTTPTKSTSRFNFRSGPLAVLVSLYQQMLFMHEIYLVPGTYIPGI